MRAGEGEVETMWFLKLIDGLVDRIVGPIIRYFWLNDRSHRP